MRARTATILILAVMGVSCSGVPDGYATKEQIIAVAERCGVHKFEPYPAGAAFAAYVPDSVPDHAAKEDCIYDTFKKQNLLVTR